MSDSKIATYTNVTIRMKNNITGEFREFSGSNRITKTALLGIARFIYGDFDNNQLESVSRYTPKYLGIGGSRGSTDPGPTSAVTVNDTALSAEITDDRLVISSRSISNNTNTEYIDVTYKIFVPSTTLKNVWINEVGLFITETGDSCWARYALPTNINKGEDETMDIIWNVRIRSLSSTSMGG